MPRDNRDQVRADDWVGLAREWLRDHPAWADLRWLRAIEQGCNAWIREASRTRIVNPKRRGRPDKQRGRVVAAMLESILRGECTIEILAREKEEALAAKYRVSRATVRAAREEVIEWEQDEHYLMRPVVRGLCKYESLIDGTLDLRDIVRMNRALDKFDGITN
jgi:hypothetical protein